MTKRQAKFCEEYKKDRDARAAAIRAGYSGKSASAYSHELLRRDEIREKLEREGAATAMDYGGEALRLLSEIARGETVEKVLCKDGEIREMPPGFKERLKAIELIERRLSCEGREDTASTVWVINDDL